MHVIIESFKRSDIQNSNADARRASVLPQQAVKQRNKGGQCFSGSRRRGDQCVEPACDRFPSARLNNCGLPESLLKPESERWMQTFTVNVRHCSITLALRPCFVRNKNGTGVLILERPVMVVNDGMVDFLWNRNNPLLDQYVPPQIHDILILSGTMSREAAFAVY